MRAVGAPRDMTAKRRCAAALDGTHDFELVQADVALVCRTPGSTMVTERYPQPPVMNRACWPMKALGLPFLRLAPFRSSRGLSTAAIMPVATLA